MSDGEAQKRAAVSKAFASLYRDHVGFVLHSLRRLGVPERHLEDVAHDVFVAVHRKFGTYDPERPARPWLFGFCYRASLDHRRLHAHRHEQLHPSGAADGEADGTPEDQASAAQARARVIHALSELPVEQRAVLVLHEMEELSVPEAAEVLGVNVNTAYSRLRLARRAFEAALRACLTPRSFAIYGGRAIG
jgi:RNA polymerase sigma-70 factor (ECF subfamily)